MQAPGRRVAWALLWLAYPLLGVAQQPDMPPPAAAAAAQPAQETLAKVASTAISSKR